MNPHSESAYFLNPLMRIFLQSLIEYVENLVPVELIPDFNRDGQIDSNDEGKTTEEERTLLAYWKTPEGLPSSFYADLEVKVVEPEDPNIDYGTVDYDEFIALQGVEPVKSLKHI